MTKCLGSCTQDGSVHHTTSGQRCHCCKQEWPCGGYLASAENTKKTPNYCVANCCRTEIQDTHHTSAGRSCHKCEQNWPCQLSGVAKRRAAVEEAKKTGGCMLRGGYSCPDTHHTLSGKVCHKCNADWPCPASTVPERPTFSSDHLFFPDGELCGLCNKKPGRDVDEHHSSMQVDCHACGHPWPCQYVRNHKHAISKAAGGDTDLQAVQDVVILTSCGGTPFRSVRADNVANLWSQTCAYCKKPQIRIKTNNGAGLPTYLTGHLKEK